MILVILHQIVFTSAVNTKFYIRECLLLLLICFLGKGHSQAALSLWNNMLEPVGAKQWAWHIGETLKCPTDQYPYIFTNKNSAKAFEEYQNSTATIVTTNRLTSVSSEPMSSTTQQHKRRKHHHKSDSDSSFSKMQLAVMAGFFFLILILLIMGITKRQQIRVYIHKKGRRHLNGFENPQYPDESDEVEIWNRSNTKSNVSVNNDIPKSHGTRISFE